LYREFGSFELFSPVLFFLWRLRKRDGIQTSDLELRAAFWASEQFAHHCVFANGYTGSANGAFTHRISSLKIHGIEKNIHKTGIAI
jgi:hypothetical protein